MRISGLRDGISFQEVFNNIVTKFTSHNPRDGCEIGVRIEGLVSELLLNCSLEDSGSTIHDREITIPDSCFPEEMKVWAVATDLLSLEHLTEQPSLSETTRAPLLMIEDSYSFKNIDWTNIESVTKAHAGVRGAWFFSNSQFGTVVVKGQEDSELQVIGSTFLRCMGMNPPDLRLIECSSDEGFAVSSLGSKHGLNERNPTHYLVMDRVMGSSYDDLHADDKSIQMINRNLKEIGTLAVYDLLLGNFDRFQLDDMSFNGGNIMFEDGLLRPIDTDCLAPNQDRQRFSRLALKKIFQSRGGYEDKISRKLTTSLMRERDEPFFNCDMILEGMQLGLQNIRELKEHEVIFVELCRERGVLLECFPPYLASMIKHVKGLTLG
jgi:hypothetical protein